MHTHRAYHWHTQAIGPVFTDSRRAVFRVRITAHPEVILGSLGEFEACPDWVPVMDTGQQFARIALKTMGDHRFDQRANRAAKVRNASRVGSQPISMFPYFALLFLRIAGPSVECGPTVDSNSWRAPCSTDVIYSAEHCGLYRPRFGWSFCPGWGRHGQKPESSGGRLGRESKKYD